MNSFLNLYASNKQQENEREIICREKEAFTLLNKSMYQTGLPNVT